MKAYLLIYKVAGDEFHYNFCEVNAKQAKAKAEEYLCEHPSYMKLTEINFRGVWHSRNNWNYDFENKRWY